MAVTGSILKVLEGFHHRAAQWITVMESRHMWDREQDYPLVDDALEAMVLCLIKEYI